MQHIITGLDAIANLLDKKGLSKYASRLDSITDSIHTDNKSQQDTDKLLPIEDAVKDLDLSNPVFNRMHNIIMNSMHDPSKNLGIKEFIGDVEVPNKVAFMYFMKELKEMENKEIEFTKDDEILINELFQVSKLG